MQTLNALADSASVQRALFWLCRLSVVSVFLESGIDKLLNWNVYIGQVAEQGMPFPPLSLAAATAVELCGSFVLLTGIFLWPGILALCAYTFMTNLFFFDFWNATGIDAVMGRKEFLKNIALIGGILALGMWMHLRGRAFRAG